MEISIKKPPVRIMNITRHMQMSLILRMVNISRELQQWNTPSVRGKCARTYRATQRTSETRVSCKNDKPR